MCCIAMRRGHGSQLLVVLAAAWLQLALADDAQRPAGAAAGQSVHIVTTACGAEAAEDIIVLLKSCALHADPANKYFIHVFMSNHTEFPFIQVGKAPPLASAHTQLPAAPLHSSKHCPSSRSSSSALRSAQVSRCPLDCLSSTTFADGPLPLSPSPRPRSRPPHRATRAAASSRRPMSTSPSTQSKPRTTQTSSAHARPIASTPPSSYQTSTRSFIWTQTRSSRRIWRSCGATLRTLPRRRRWRRRGRGFSAASRRRGAFG